MSNAIELAERRRVELSYLQTVGTVLAESHYFADAQTAEKAVAKILAGQEFGMGVMESMRSFHVIDGKVEMSADTQARLVKSHPRYDYYVKALDDEVCSITFVEVDDTRREIGTSVFTMEDARRAGIVKDGSAWTKYPKNMLFARALTNGVAWFCPDAIAGGRVYAPGEVSEEPWEVQVPAELEAAVKDSPDVEPVAGTHADGEVKAEGSAPADPTREGGDDARVYGEGTGAESPPSPTEPLLLSSQAKQLLRHAAALRWNDADISAAVDEAYPGLGSIGELSQEQARALIPEWANLVKSTRVTQEQKDRLKGLATNADAARRAQVLFGADHIKNTGDLTSAEAAALISDLESQRGAA